MGDGILTVQTSILVEVEAASLLQHEMLADVRFGSGADIRPLNHDVCFTPKTGHRATGPQCPLRAISDHSRRSKRHAHSITSSASASSLSGISRPSDLAVLRLITNSNLSDRTTGRSAGFSPLRIRPA